MNTTATTVSPITEKQLAYLTALVNERDPENIEVGMVKAAMKAGTLTKTTASTAISAMLSLPRKKAAPVVVTVTNPIPSFATATATPPAEVKVGLYDTTPHKPVGDVTSGRYIMVVKTHKGYLQAKRMYKSWDTKSGWSWRKMSLYTAKTLVHAGKAVPVDNDSAAHLGKELGFCAFCLAALTTDESISAGYGPVCAAKWNLPWGLGKGE